MTRAYPKVSLKGIDRSNVRAVIALDVTPEQRPWVAPNVQSLAEAYANPRATALAIYDGDTIVSAPLLRHHPVGFVMYQVWDEVGFVQRLMIAAEHQGRGYGRAAMVEVIRRLRATPEVSYIGTSVHRDNPAAHALYTSLGFGPAPWPPEDPGDDVYLALDLPAERA